MRRMMMLVTSTLLLLGCDLKSPNERPQRLSKNCTFAIYAVSSTSGVNTKTETDPEGGSPIYLTTPAIITSADVISVQLSKKSAEDQSLNINLTPDGGAKLSAATATPGGMRLAIVVNEKVVTAPKIHSTLSKQISISGPKTQSILDSLTRN